jgi:hypothetical protein
LKACEFLELEKGNAVAGDAVVGTKVSGHDHAGHADPRGPSARCGLASRGICPCWVID